MTEPTDIASRRRPATPARPRSTPCTVLLRLYLPAFALFLNMPQAANG